MSSAFRGCLIAVGLLIVVSAVGVYALAVRHMHDRIDAKAAEIERLRRQGMPTNLTELAESYHTDSDAQQLGETFIKAYGTYQASHQFYTEGDFERRIARVGEQPNTEHIDALRTHLELNADYVADVQRLLQEPREVQYPIDFSRGVEVQIEFAEDVQNTVYLFVAAASIAAIETDAAGVVQNLRDAVYINETLRDVPISTVQLVRIKNVSTIVDQCEYAVNRLTLPRNLLEQVRRVFNSLKLDGMIAFGIRWDLCAFPANLLDGSEAPLLGVLPSPEIFSREVQSANLFLRYPEAIRIGDALPWERQQLAERLLQALDDQGQSFNTLERIMMPATVRAYDAENRVLSEVETAKVGLEVLSYSQDTGTLPDDLGVLVPKYMDAVPRDAFDGEPVRYRRTDQGFVVYSIGPNRVDDGGNPPPQENEIYKTGDLVFRVFDVAPYLQQKDAA